MHYRALLVRTVPSITGRCTIQLNSEYRKQLLFTVLQLKLQTPVVKSSFVAKGKERRAKTSSAVNK